MGSGHPNTSVTDENLEKKSENIFIREVADEIGFSYGWCKVIFNHALCMKQVAVKCDAITEFLKNYMVTASERRLNR